MYRFIKSLQYIGRSALSSENIPTNLVYCQLSTWCPTSYSSKSKASVANIVNKITSSSASCVSPMPICISRGKELPVFRCIQWLTIFSKKSINKPTGSNNFPVTMVFSLKPRSRFTNTFPVGWDWSKSFITESFRLGPYSWFTRLLFRILFMNTW